MWDLPDSQLTRISFTRPWTIGLFLTVTTTLQCRFMKLATVGILVLASVTVAESQSKQLRISLCSSQGKVAEGEHLTVAVAGIYQGGLGDSGPAMGVLYDDACPDQNAWVEIDLQSSVNRKKLNQLLERSDRARVVFEGELYGPPAPDPKLPEAIRKAYHPGWGHLGAFKTKLVVRVIREVTTAPAPKR
jgi:hypothetical protein